MTSNREDEPHPFVRGDLVARALEAAITALEAGAPAHAIESQWVEVKQDPDTAPDHAGRRARSAERLAIAAACFANSTEGGALMVGVSDDGEALGTTLDAAWLRGRIGELTNEVLYPYVVERRVRGARCLVLYVYPSPVPVTVRGRVHMRVDDRCVPVPEGTWTRFRVERGLLDWSAATSQVLADEVSRRAVETVRRLMTTAAEPEERAAAPSSTLLERLDVVTSSGHLTNAGALLLAPTRRPVLDYRRREHDGGDSLLRVVREDIGALEQLEEVLTAMRLSSRTTQLLRPDGVVEQLPDLPERARREAIVNALVHRDWTAPEPIEIEHVGSVLRVTSPGRLPTGITPDNIISHPAVRRSPHLADVMGRLGLAEREAIGVDRMFLDLVADGHPRPRIEELDERLRVVLVGGAVQQDWARAVRAVEPAIRGDASAMLAVHHIVTTGVASANSVATAIQRSPEEADALLARLASVTLGDELLIRRVELSNRASQPSLVTTSSALPTPRGTGGLSRSALLWRCFELAATLTATEAMSLTSVSRPTALRDLAELVHEGAIEVRGNGPTRHYATRATSRGSVG